MRGLLVGIVLALLSLPACRARAATQPQGSPQDSPPGSPQPPPVQTPPVQAPPVQALSPQVPQPVQPPAGSPVFVIYPAIPPQHATILLNAVTGETWLLGVNGPDGQYQWTRIAVGDPGETAAAPR